MAAKRSGRHTAREWKHPALSATLRLLGADRRKSGDEDRPPLSRFPGRQRTGIEGQLSLLGDDPDDDPDDDGGCAA